jgi:phage shock protein A
VENNSQENELRGNDVNTTEAKEFILGLISTLKLTEKEIRSLEDEAAKWKGRVELALSKEKNDLAGDAERELQKINTKLEGLREEESSLKGEIDSMRRQLPGIAARERNIDPYLLEQELSMLLEELKAEC